CTRTTPTSRGSPGCAGETRWRVSSDDRGDGSPRRGHQRAGSEVPMHATKLALLVPLLAGCPDRTIAGVPVDQGSVDTKIIPAVPRRDVDILFLIDDSGSMEE